MPNIDVDHITGFMLGVAVTALFSSFMLSDRVNAYDLAIELCEKDLPRNQICLITAIPKESE